MPTSVPQRSFGGGELAPSLWARADLAKYQSGCRTLRNMICHAHGGASNRPGLKFVAEVKNSAARVRLIPFSFSTTQTYVLEFGNLYMRVYKDGGQVLSAGVPYEIVTPYVTADLARLKFTQSADVMTIVHPSYAPRNLSRTGHTAWTLSTISLAPTLAAPASPAASASHAGPGSTPSQTLYYRVTAVTGAGETLPSAAAEVQCFALGTTVGSTTASVLLTWTAVAGATQYHLYRGTAAGTTTRFQSTSLLAYTDYGLGSSATAPPGAGAAGPTLTVTPNPNPAITGTTTETYNYKITAVTEAGEESLPSSAASATGLKLGTAVPDTTPVQYPKYSISWSAVTGASKYNVYKEVHGGGVYGFIGSATNTTFVDDNILPDGTDTPPGSRNPFAASNNPGVVTYHQQRRVFAASTTGPQTVWMSQSGNYQNFNVSEPSKADDAVTFTLAAAQVNEIRALVPHNDLLVMTVSGEFKVSGGTNADAITPSSLVVKPQGYRGSSHVPPLVIGETVLFVQSKGSIVRDLAYNIQVDGYSGNDLSVLSNHLFESRTISEWCYAQAPHSIVWAVTSDGALLSLTYLKEHEVWAWTRHDTLGTFESICSVSEGSEDAVYVVVNRTIGGATKRYVERMASRIVSDVDDAFFVDSGLSYSGTAVTTVSGLDHLNGQTVAVLADGSVQAQRTVSGGAITLDHSASTIHVGLPYTSELRTLDLELGPQRAGQYRRVVRVTVKMERSRGLWVGPDPDHVVEWKQRSSEPYGDPIALLTGEARITIPPSWGTSGSVTLQQHDPLPLTVLGVFPEVEIGG
jgi:hypothetical protein